MDKRNEFAFKYIRDRGIEIGALHQPLPVPSNVDVKYVDRLDKNDLQEHYPELQELNIVSPNIIDDAETLNKIRDDEYDFCICNHVLEHLSNPINAFTNWLRVLKPGGILFMSVPDINNPLDCGRKLTTLEHLIKDNQGSDNNDDYGHFIECAKYWMTNLNTVKEKYDQIEIETIARKNWEMKYSIHYHTFNKNSLTQLFSHLISTLDGQFQIIDYHENEFNGVKEHLYIIEKMGYIDKILDILRHINEQKNTQINCDVIIPVYNAYFDFIKCLYSVLKYRTDYRIICINDNSLDPRIDELFSKIKPYEHENFILLNNAMNIGFVETVNKGMKYSKNDVILLNSDTVVTEKWATKLNRCAYSEDRIATVTPLSNNATICSVPNFCQDNTIPEGLAVESFAYFIEKISLKEYPEIPTAVGFCMFIKQSAINEIGYFDSLTYGKGYGEENDFCMRAVKAGYTNVLCDDTFIFHRGAASFSLNQTELMDKNLKIISEKYPYYFTKVEEFCHSNPLESIQNNIKLRIKTWDNIGKQKILFLLHNLGGGTEYHVMDLVQSLKSSYIFYVLQVEFNQIILTEYANNNTLKYIFPINHSISYGTIFNDELNNIYRVIINTFHINAIHVHHLLFHTVDIFNIAKEQNLPIFMTVHDFYIVCPTINLLDEKYEYCGDNNNDFDKCDRCLSKRFHLPDKYITTWHKNFQMVIENCDLLIAPNKSVFKILKNYYVIPDNKTLVIEHAHYDEVVEEMDSLNLLSKNIKNDKFHVAYIGSFAKHKGNKVFITMAKSSELKKKTKWSVFGDPDVHIHGFDSSLNINFYGKYEDFKELKSLLKSEKVELVFLPSKWPETFSYTLSEAWASGIPVLVSDMGALGERVKRTGGGWTVDISNLKKIEDKVLNIMESPDDYMQKKENVKKITFKNFNDMQKEYDMIYSKYISTSDPLYQNEFIVSNLDIFHTIKDEHKVKYTSNIIIRFFECLRENGMIYTIKKGYFYLYSYIQNMLSSSQT
ncbi:MAG: glycosyltransferase [Methanosarcinales archaeon]|nr:glycosyltransferase [Methanosarcinales archaeon]